MKLQTFFEKFELFAGAPGAVAKMRELVLQLAVQGKLVSPDRTDEPIERTFPRFVGSDVRHNGDTFPSHWFPVPLGSMGEWRGGGTPSKSRSQFWEGPIPWVSPKDMKSLLISDAQDHISEAAIESCSVRRIPPGSLLMVVRGMILSRAFPVAVASREVTINQDMKSLQPYEQEITEFLLLVLRALEPAVLARIERSTHGTCKLNTEVLHALTIPLPPLSEQKRIVAKVDELMALCDRLEAQEKDREVRHASLARASLARFTAAPTPANLNYLVHNSYTITPADLRNIILTLAVQGNLVRQDSKDIPAEQLLASVANELDSGKRRHFDKGSENEEPPYELPRGWAWSHFPFLGNFGRGKSRNRPRNDPKLFVGGQYPLVQTGDVARSNGTITTYSNLYNDVGLEQSKMWPAGTLCITIAANIADSGILGFPACIPD
jgi:type I restriction enzyme S subunit